MFVSIALQLTGEWLRVAHHGTSVPVSVNDPVT